MDGDILLRNVLTDPADNTARLVYADWLEENGQGERAHFIRDQINGPYGWKKPLAAQMRDWFGVWWARRIASQKGRVGKTANLGLAPLNTPADLRHKPDWGFVDVRRGFTESVTLKLTTFENVFKKLFLSQPVEFVKLMDKQPYTDEDDTSYLEAGDEGWHRHHVPAWLFHTHLAEFGKRCLGEGKRYRVRFPDYTTGAQALSHALTNYARKQVGLPKLYHPQPKTQDELGGSGVPFVS
jgi:uncharacterized protein (TIGR02996 family)